MTDESENAGDFGRSFRQFMETMATEQEPGDPPFLALFRDHFQRPTDDLVVVGERFGVSQHPNVQLAIEHMTGADGVESRLVGIQGLTHDYGFSMSTLLQPRQSGLMRGEELQIGPVEYRTRDRDRGVPLSCVQLGVFLVTRGDERFAILVRGPSEMGWAPEIRVEVMAGERSASEGVLRQLRRHLRELNVYRGKVISLATDQRNSINVQFREVPTIERNAIVLPDGLLDRIERHTIRFTEVSDRLRDAGRHLKRGMLLHGPPGTGKTLTAMYLVSRMEGRTVLIITGRGAALIEHACDIARYLQPATVILEDVDLIAEERTRQEAGCGVLLFELLNQMDGIGEDADILFLLTTNRPDILEPALAARPGRIDQAVEIPLPDAAGRRRLVELYADGLTLDTGNLDSLVERSKGVSGAFIRELLRKAALLAADEHEGDIIVRDSHLDEAFRELVVSGGDLTRALLGARQGE